MKSEIIISIALILIVCATYLFGKFLSTIDLSEEDKEYQQCLLVLQNKDCYSKTKIQEAHQFIDDYLYSRNE